MWKNLYEKHAPMINNYINSLYKRTNKSLFKAKNNLLLAKGVTDSQQFMIYSKITVLN